ncbi:hypothetical protein [Haladaptatus sp. DFWS20]|uniref:hypothetical protein n=1 Tax=Haladaptatus sp. DFWS20 TaxID=3403467 RepID=UPI003EBD8A4B
MHQTSPELPSLDPGITLLETDGRMNGSLQSLVLDLLTLGTLLPEIDELRILF